MKIRLARASGATFGVDDISCAALRAVSREELIAEPFVAAALEQLGRHAAAFDQGVTA